MAVQLTGLSELAAEYGRHSEQYKLAAETVRGFLSSMTEMRDLKLAVVMLPPSMSLAKRQASSSLQPPLLTEGGLLYEEKFCQDMVWVFNHAFPCQYVE